MADEREPDDLIDPQWLMRARKNRVRFMYRVVVIFLAFSVLSWWALPKLVERSEEVKAKMEKRGEKLEIPGDVGLLLNLAGVFKVFWVGIAIGCGAAVLLAMTGKIDTLIPLLNLVLILAAAAAVGFTIYVFYAPMRILIEGA